MPGAHVSKVESYQANSLLQKSEFSSIDKDLDYIDSLKKPDSITKKDQTQGIKKDEITLLVLDILKKHNLTSKPYFEEPCHLIDDTNSGAECIRMNVVSEEIKKLRHIINYDIEHYGINKMLKFFDFQKFDHLTQCEYNLMFFSFLSLNTREKLMTHKILPLELNTQDFINEVIRISGLSTLDEEQVEEKIHSYVPMDNDILVIVSELESILDMTNSWTQDIKDKNKACFFLIE